MKKYYYMMIFLLCAFLFSCTINPTYQTNDDISIINSDSTLYGYKVFYGSATDGKIQMETFYFTVSNEQKLFVHSECGTNIVSVGLKNKLYYKSEEQVIHNIYSSTAPISIFKK